MRTKQKEKSERGRGKRITGGKVEENKAVNIE